MSPPSASLRSGLSFQPPTVKVTPPHRLVRRRRCCTSAHRNTNATLLVSTFRPQYHLGCKTMTRIKVYVPFDDQLHPGMQCGQGAAHKEQNALEWDFDGYFVDGVGEDEGDGVT